MNLHVNKMSLKQINGKIKIDISKNKTEIPYSYL